VTRGYTHVITDVFEDDPHSPLGFHTRVMGFRPVGTHDHGDLNCKNRRITLLLDLKSSSQRLRRAATGSTPTSPRAGRTLCTGALQPEGLGAARGGRSGGAPDIKGAARLAARWPGFAVLSFGARMPTRWTTESRSTGPFSCSL